MSQAPTFQNPQSTEQPGGATLVAVSLVIAFITAVLMLLYIARVKQQANEDMVTVYTLTRSVRPGDRIRKRDIESVSIPKRFDEAMSKIGVIMDPDAVDLRLTEKREFKQSAGQGQLLTFDLFDESIIIKPPNIRDGYREIALKVNSKYITGKITPGHFVDIYAPFSTGGAIPETLLVLENIKVVALGERTVDDPGGTGRGSSYHTITIQVKRDVAQNLSNITRMIPEEQSYELHLKRPDDVKGLQNKPGEISETVMKLMRNQLPNTTRKGGS